MQAKRMTPAARKDQIFAVALKVAERNRYDQMTRDQIATAAGVSVGLISTYFGTMANLRRDIMRHAVKQRILSIVAQGLLANDQYAKRAPEELRRAAFAAQV